MARRKEPQLPDAILEQLLSGAQAGAASGQGGLLDRLQQAQAERALHAEMDHRLAGGAGAGNRRNGHGRLRRRDRLEACARHQHARDRGPPAPISTASQVSPELISTVGDAGMARSMLRQRKRHAVAGHYAAG